MSEATKADRPLPVLSSEGLGLAPERADVAAKLALLAQTLEFSDDVRCTIQRGADEIERLRAALAAERERCAQVCKGAREAASHSRDGLKRAGAMAMAASCAMLIRA